MALEAPVPSRTRLHQNSATAILVLIGLVTAYVAWDSMRRAQAWTFLTTHAFLVLAVLPGTIAIFNFLVSVESKFEKLKEQTTAMTHKSGKVSPLYEDVEPYRPTVTGLLAGAFCLSTVFALSDAVSHNTDAFLGLGMKAVAAGHRAEPPSSHSASASTSASARAPLVLPSATPTGEVPSPAPGGGNKDTDRTKGAAAESEVAGGFATTEGKLGFVYAAYGAYIWTMYLVISRINTAALTSRFLMNCAARSAIAVVLGFVAAQLGVFSALSGKQVQFAYFALGLFPAAALGALRKKAAEIFQSPELGCESLPLCMVDGLDDGIVDRLGELGIWDIQHLATSNPLTLVARSLYPPRQVIDWVDQAILISYVRGKIVHFRALGLRGAVDAAVMYREHDSIADSSPRAPKFAERAVAVLKSLSQKTDMSEEALLTISGNLHDDPLVQFIWHLWFDGDSAQENGSPPASPTNPPSSVPPTAGPSSSQAGA